MIIQLTHEHLFELVRSAYTWVFFQYSYLYFHFMDLYEDKICVHNIWDQKI